MLTIPTILAESAIHGLGCFTSMDIPEGMMVWKCDRRVDAWHGGARLTEWERNHAYKSHAQAEPVWILPRDNAAYMNFSPTPNLIEGPLVDGEPSLVARCAIAAGAELTVGVETDADASRKLGLRPFCQI